MRHFCCIVLAAVLLAGCSMAGIEQDVLSEEELTPITFSAYSGNAFTKAPVTNIDSLKKTGFLMYANVNMPGVSGVQRFMNAQKIEWNNTSGSWLYSPVKYWPTTDGATVDFYPRYTDSTSNVNISYDWNNIPQVIFYVNQTVSKQTDMLWAAPVLGAERETYATAPVSVTFKHALTSFFFTIKLDKDYTNTKVKVKSLTVDGYFAPKATLNPKETDINKIWTLQGDWDRRTYTISTDGDNEVTEKSANGEISSTAATPITDTLGRIMVLPFDNTEYTVTLVYVLEVTDTADPSKVSTTTNSVSYTVTDAELKPGVQITTNLVLKLNVINFTSDLDGFTEIDVTPAQG